MKTNILVTAVNSPPGRSTFLSLKKNKNFKIFSIDSDPNSVFKFLGMKNFFISPNVNKKNYKKFINNVIKKNKIKIIIPCIEPEVVFFSKNKKYYDKKNVKCLVPEKKILVKVINKYNLYQHCKKIKIKTPKTTKITFPFSIKKLKFKFPFIIKPIIGWGMNNVYIIKKKDEFNKITKNLKGKYIIQKYLGNYNKNVFAVSMLFDDKNNEKMNFVSKSILTKYKNGGPATAGIVVKNKFLLKTVKKLLNSLKNYSGPAMVEFIKLKGKNNFSLIDFNPRIWGYSQLATFNGKNFPQAIVDIHLKNNITKKNTSKKYLMIRDFVDLKILNK